MNLLIMKVFSLSVILERERGTRTREKSAIGLTNEWGWKWCPKKRRLTPQEASALTGIELGFSV